MWEAIARLEAVKQILSYDYAGERPSRNDLWWQVTRAYLAAAGVHRPGEQPWETPQAHATRTGD